MEKLPGPFLLVSKPYGITSRQFLNEISAVLGIKKMGHAGTLDPMATGLLLIAFGKGTRFIQFIPAEEKEYVIEVTFGILTDTWDITGKVLRKENVQVSREQVEKCIESFVGEIEQTPSIYSAKKYKGKELYKYARSGIYDVELKPAKVTIKSINLLGFSNSRISLRVACSKGTYMRSLAYDFGVKLETPATLSAIARTRIGKFEISRATTITRLRAGDFSRGFLTFDEAFAEVHHILLSSREDFTNGRDFREGTVFLVKHSGKTLGIAKLKGGNLHPEVVVDEDNQPI